jgi:hypothetical protein
MSNLSELKDFYTELVTQVYFYNPDSTGLVNIFDPTAVTYEDYKHVILTSGSFWEMVLDSREDIDGQLTWTEKDFCQIDSYLRKVV